MSTDIKAKFSIVHRKKKKIHENENIRYDEIPALFGHDDDNGEWNSYFIVEEFFSEKLASLRRYQRGERGSRYMRYLDMSESKERGKVIKSPNNVSNI